MQLFNGLNMRILGLCKINNEENPSEKPSAETYENSQNAQLNKIKKEISELTDTLANGSLNTSNDKIEIQWTLTTEFVNYLKSNKDVAKSLNDAVQKINADNLDEDSKRAVDNLKNFLEPIVNKSFSDTYDVSELYNMQSTNNGEKGKFANWVDVAPEWSESKVKNLLVDIDVKISTYESILNNENNKDIKTTLEKLKMVLDNPVEENVKILQKVIYDNLDDENKNKFLQENRNKKNYNENDKFDWKFWKCMVEWTKKWLQIIENNLKSLKDAQDVISESEKNNLLWKIKPDIVADANSDPKNWFNDLPEWTDVKFKNDSEKAKLNTVWDNTEIKLIVTTNGASEEISVKVKVVEKVQTNPKISESLKIGDVEYPIVNPQNVKNLPQIGWATFYLTTEIASPAPEGWEQWQQNPETENGERVFYLKFGNWDLFRVKVDNDWNLCPVATKVNDKNPKETVQTLIKNNESCINYLKNKLPGVIKDKCRIAWGGDDYVIWKDGYANWLTIEPMTIDWKWLSSGEQPVNLSDSLAFLNFTNFLRNEGKIMGVEFKDDNPDLTIQNDQLYVRVNRKINKKISKNRGEEKGELWRKYQKINLDSFWLPLVSSKAMKSFIKYNNGEDWNDNWDKKKDNKGYTKVDFPNVVVNNPTNPETTTTTNPETTTTTNPETSTTANPETSTPANPETTTTANPETTTTTNPETTTTTNPETTTTANPETTTTANPETTTTANPETSVNKQKTPESKKSDLEKFVGKLWLKENHTLYEDQRSYYWLPEKGKIYSRDGKSGYYYIEWWDVVYVPNFGGENKNLLFCKQKMNMQTYLQTWRESWIKEYPPTCKWWCEYLSKMMVPWKNKYILSDANKYYMESFGQKVSINEKTFREWWIFSDLWKSLKMLDFSNYMVNRYRLMEKNKSLLKYPKFKFDKSGKVILTTEENKIFPKDYLRRDERGENVNEKTIIELFEKHIWSLTLEQWEMFCRYLNRKCWIS